MSWRVRLKRPLRLMASQRWVFFLKKNYAWAGCSVHTRSENATGLRLLLRGKRGKRSMLLLVTNDIAANGHLRPFLTLSGVAAAYSTAHVPVLDTFCWWFAAIGKEYSERRRTTPIFLDREWLAWRRAVRCAKECSGFRVHAREALSLGVSARSFSIRCDLMGTAYCKHGSQSILSLSRWLEAPPRRHRSQSLRVP